MSPRPWVLAEMTYHDFLTRRPEVAVLPFGATEPHNYHLPYGTDTIEADVIGSALCEEATRRGADVVLLPTIPYGTESNLVGFPFALNLSPSTTLLILRDLIESLDQMGVQKCVLLNSHGGNAFKGHLRELCGRTKAQLFLINWYAVAKERYFEVFEQADDHAGEMETSVILACRPELVYLDRADPGAPARSRFDAVTKGWVELTRPWTRLTKSSGVGDPRAATAAKGRRWIEIIVECLTPFLVELAHSPLDDSFPFEPTST